LAEKFKGGSLMWGGDAARREKSGARWTLMGAITGAINLTQVENKGDGKEYWGNGKKSQVDK